VGSLSLYYLSATNSKSRMGVNNYSHTVELGTFDIVQSAGYKLPLRRLWPLALTWA